MIIGKRIKAIEHGRGYDDEGNPVQYIKYIELQNGHRLIPYPVKVDGVEQVFFKYKYPNQPTSKFEVPYKQEELYDQELGMKKRELRWRLKDIIGDVIMDVLEDDYE